MKILLATDGSDSARAATDFLVRFPLPAAQNQMVSEVLQGVFGYPLGHLQSEADNEVDRVQGQPLDWRLAIGDWRLGKCSETRRRAVWEVNRKP